ncbi:unnamed protein product [Dicrocoelium dendriticum]|nr:unnamed protein product [Dicrocoelium dendriticum]CAH8585016.1 unnamed protein product [Dicrocoelium dendriticum]
MTTPESRTTGSVSPRIQSVAPGTHTSESGLAQPEWQYLEVVLKKDAPTGGYGFSIAGGIDFPISEGDPGIYVTRIAPNGCADVDGRLRVDDQILTVNGISLEQVSNLEAVQTMKRAGNSLQLVIRRYIGDFTAADPRAPDIPGSPETRSPEASSDFEEKQLEPVWFEVQLRKSSPTAGLGLSVAGGKDYEHDETIAQGLYVTRINPNGLAHKDGRIQPGDQLMQVSARRDSCQSWGSL